MDLFIQIVGFVGCGLIALSNLQKKKNNLILMQAFGGMIFCVHYVLLGAWSGALMNGVSILRGFAFRFLGKSRRSGAVLVAVFVPLIVACFFIGAFLLRDPAVPLDLRFILVELLPIAAMVLATFSFAMSSAEKIRRISLIVSPMWLAYNIFHLSIGGIVCESINLCAILVGIFVIDRRAKARESAGK